jgi:hypothetical protein
MGIFGELLSCWVQRTKDGGFQVDTMKVTFVYNINYL